MVSLIQSPTNRTTLSRQKIIFSATTDNGAEPGYRVKITVLIQDVEIYSGYWFLNPSGSAIFDLAPFVKTRMKAIVNDESVHKFASATHLGEPEGYGQITNIVVRAVDAWIVDGVLSDNPDEDTPTEIALNVFNGSFQPSDGANPNINPRYSLDGVTKRWMSDREWNTHVPPSALNQVMSTSIVYIPVREADYGLFTFQLDIPFTSPDVFKIVVTIFASNGTPNTFSILTNPMGNVVHMPLYPANLNDSEEDGWLHPEDFPGWRYIQIRAEDEEDNVISVNYRLYNTAVYGPLDCKHDNVRIGWENSAGGWDYFNFTKRNEISNDIDPKRFRQVLGNYGTTFTMTGMERGLTEREKLVEQTLTASSDWISENEFVFLGGLFRSKQVHWIHDDGTFTPVVVEDRSFIEQRGRNGKLVNQQIKLKMANEYWT